MAEAEVDPTVEATLRASRALLGVVARSVAPVLDRVSLPQFRVLVLLADGGTMRSGQLADQLGVRPSTFTRMADRLVAAGWIERQEAPSRREVRIVLTGAGADLVADVTNRRREALAEIIAPLPAASRRQLLDVLQMFAEAAGEPSVDDLATLGL